MGCLKCGREIDGKQVFCDGCLEVMDANPVRPGTLVLLPKHKPQATAKKQSRKRALPPEEQVLHLKKALRRMYLCVTVLILALGLATVLLLHEVTENTKPAIGQNYTIDTTLNTE